MSRSQRSHSVTTLRGASALGAWLGVDAALMSGFRDRIDAFVDWGWDYFSKSRGSQLETAARTTGSTGDEDEPAAADPG